MCSGTFFDFTSEKTCFGLSRKTTPHAIPRKVPVVSCVLHPRLRASWTRDQRRHPLSNQQLERTGAGTGTCSLVMNAVNLSPLSKSTKQVFDSDVYAGSHPCTFIVNEAFWPDEAPEDIVHSRSLAHCPFRPHARILFSLTRCDGQTRYLPFRLCIRLNEPSTQFRIRHEVIVPCVGEKSDRVQFCRFICVGYVNICRNWSCHIRRHVRVARRHHHHNVWSSGVIVFLIGIHRLNCVVVVICSRHVSGSPHKTQLM